MAISYIQKLALSSVSLVARSLVSFGAAFFAAHTLAPDQFYLITTGLIISLLAQTLADWGFNLTIYRERCSSRDIQDQPLIAGKLFWSILIALVTHGLRDIGPFVNLKTVVFNVWHGAPLKKIGYHSKMSRLPE